MASTFLQLKNETANRSGRTDGGTANTIRDNAINNSIRFTIGDAYPFSWLRVTTTVATDTNGDADLPATYNPTHKLQPGWVRVVGSGSYDDTVLGEVPLEVFDRYDSAGQNRFYIDYNTSTNVFRIRSTEPSVTITITYVQRLAELSADADVCIVPDSECVSLLASAKVWLAKERDETNHDRDNALGLQRLNQMILNDKRANPLRPVRSSPYNVDLGYNRPG